MSEYMDIIKEFRIKEYAKLQQTWDSFTSGIYTISELANKSGVTFSRAKRFVKDKNIKVNVKEFESNKKRLYIVRE